MNRRQLLKTLSALPFVSFFLPAKAAGPKVERWAYQMFEYGAQMGVAATVHFHDPKLGLRQKRAAARFMLPEPQCSAADAQRAFPKLIEQARQCVLEQLRTGTGVVYDDDVLEGNERWLDT